MFKFGKWENGGAYEALTSLESANLLRETGYLKIKEYLTEDEHELILNEIMQLQKSHLRRDFIMPGYETPRNLSVAGGRLIRRTCPKIQAMYEDQTIANLIERQAGRPIYQIDHPEECIVVNTLSAQGDTHGWHLDDPKYAFVIAIKAPRSGGMIELIPNWNAFQKAFSVESLPLSEQVKLADQENLIIRDFLDARDAYILDAGSTLHRVTPLQKGIRTVINFAFHDKPEVVYGDTATLLYQANKEKQ